MKILKTITFFLALILLLLLGAYFYFDQKFTPEKNYLTLKNESGKIPIIWEDADKKALLIPVHFQNDTVTYHMQLDTGSPYTVLYTKSIKSIKSVELKNGVAKTTFSIGNTTVSSDQFKLIDNGNGFQEKDSIKTIGTIGSDIIENRKTLINFRENYVVFNLSKMPKSFQSKMMDFKLKKRKIIIPATLNGEEKEFLYDSGTSAFELLISKEVWNTLKTPHSKIMVEKGKSWENVLTTYTAECNASIYFKDKKIPLHTMTYVEGFSQTQYLLMKFSGMTGMLGNKFFQDHCIYIDGSVKKIGID